MIVFCRDGILRFEMWEYNRKLKSGKYYAVPMTEYEKQSHSSFLYNLGRSFSFEEGLTLREMMVNLKPWAGLISDLADMDYSAFLREVEKTPKVMTIDGKSADPQYADFSHIEISGCITIDALPKYKKKQSSDEDDWLGRINSPMITDKYHITEMWDYSGIIKTPYFDENAGMQVSRYSLSFVPLCEIAHLPVILKTNIGLYDQSPGGGSRSHLSHGCSLFNPDNPLLTAHKGMDGTVCTYGVSVPYNPSFFKAIILGVFREMGFHGSPESRDERLGEIHERIDEVNEQITETVVSPEPQIEKDEEEDEISHDSLIIRAIMEQCGELVRIRDESNVSESD